MTHSTDTLTLARWMAADFSNQDQAWENPPFFTHVRVCMRPLPYDLLSGIALYLEQAYDYMLETPYRTSVLKFVAREDDIEIENYRVVEAPEFFGAARQPEKLRSLSLANLERLEGCSFIARWNGSAFQAEVESGKRCLVFRNGKNTYLDSTFEIDAKCFSSHDRGFDVQTGEHVWGAIAGPFQFVRRASFADEVPLPPPTVDS